MDLFLLRHGPAGDAAKLNLADDDARPLTKKGRKRTRDVLRGAKALGVRAEGIVTSPLVRAEETAAIAAKVFGCKDVAPDRALAPAGTPAAAVAALAKALRGVEAAIVVGHEPNLSRLASTLIVGTPYAALRLRKAGLIHLSVAAFGRGKCGELRRLWDPDDLAAMVDRR